MYLYSICGFRAQRYMHPDGIAKRYPVGAPFGTSVDIDVSSFVLTPGYGITLQMLPRGMSLRKLPLSVTITHSPGWSATQPFASDQQI